MSADVCNCGGSSFLQPPRMMKPPQARLSSTKKIRKQPSPARTL
uniref:Uncharacterized protein n=1 Tax=Anguilla anguilla TaxID=7936 RepID=A0A0E9RHE7_ANGAN